MTTKVEDLKAAESEPRGETGSYWTIFSEKTSLHGVRSIGDPDYRILRRLLWIVLLLICTGSFLFNLIKCITRYTSYPSTVSIDVIPHTALTLPDVTICNSNRIRKSFMENPNSQSYFSPATDIETSGQVPDIFKLFANAIDPMESFISKCSINMIDFDCKDNIQLTSTFNGFCYTLSPLNYPLNVSGPSFGLNFEVSLNESEYSEFFPPQGAGVKLLLHGHGEVPDEGLEVNIQPGTVAHAAVRKSKNIRLGTPYSKEDCHDGGTEDMSFSVYTKRTCEMECYADYFEKHVGCDFRGIHKTLHNCTFFEYIGAAVESFKYIHGPACKCLRPCSETLYSPQMSTLSYLTTSPHEPYIKKIVFNIFYPHFDVEVVEQEASYVFSSFVAEVGGHMGFFLGASILTISELIEFVVVCVTSKCSLKLGGKSL